MENTTLTNNGSFLEQTYKTLYEQGIELEPMFNGEIEVVITYAKHLIIGVALGEVIVTTFTLEDGELVPDDNIPIFSLGRLENFVAPEVLADAIDGAVEQAKNAAP